MEKTKDTHEEANNGEELLSEHQEAPINQERADDAPVSNDGLTEEPRDKSDGKAEDELLEMKDKYLRLYSEFENFRRRTSKEKLDLIQSANEQLIKSLLPVVDDFERAEKAATEASGSELEGFLLIQSKLRKILEQYGVEPMDIEAGSDFDADTQEAITQIQAPEEKLKGKVVDVVEKGYLLNDKVIRYAKVVVGN